MSRALSALLISTLLGVCLIGWAQPAMQTGGALIIVPAYGEVRHPNDEARVTLMIEEQDKDKAVASSRVNQKMKQGTEIVKREDPTATFKTHGYYTYPVYADDQPRQNNRTRPPVAWRVGQYLEVTTTNLNGLPKTVAAAQRLLALNGLRFGLTDASRKKLDEQGIAAAYQDLTSRVAAIANTMGRSVSETVLETVDFEASGNYAPKQDSATSAMAMRSSGMQESAKVEEPSFEAGETTLHMRVVGKVRFK